jgi:hypothetical protein
MFDNSSEYDFYYDHDHNKYYVNDIESQCYVNLKPKYIPRKSSYSLKDIKTINENTNDNYYDDNEKEKETSPLKILMLVSTFLVANVAYYYLVFIFT